MTTRTRGLVFLSVLVFLITVPAELALVQAIVTPNQRAAVRQWVTRLSPDALATAAGRIQVFPMSYRREIMRALPLDQRSNVWRRHLRDYVRARPQLDPAAVALVETAARLLTPGFFAGPTDAQRASLHAVGEQMQATLGAADTEYLLLTLGPRDGTFASFEPLAMRLGNAARSLFVVAAQSWDCDCASTFGCYDLSMHCSQAYACYADTDWPACGWAWSDPCDSICLGGW